ncbi:MAG: group II truncated hemoglobin [Pseudomonadota bacterium]
MNEKEETIDRSLSTYKLLGGDEALRTLVEEFYKEMETKPEVKTIRELHPKDLRSAKEKLFMFLSGWMGGPDRYIAAFGHPRLRARHLPFTIGTAERDQWLQCMQTALDKLDIESVFRQQLMASFTQTAHHMINTSD